MSMACFLVPVGEAVLTTVAQKVAESRERRAIGRGEKKSGGIGAASTGVKWSQRLGWLNKMLWGGSILLALEHVWHGEVIPWPPFLTAMETPGEVGPMLHEMATYGVTMAVVVTVVWAIIVVIAELRAKAMLREEAHVAGGGA
jgi:hypothetical protein